MMRLTAAVLALLLFAFPGAAVAGDCDACTDDVMCLRHQKEQTEALAKFKKLSKSKDAIVRKDALDALGKINNDHMDFRSADVATEIAKMLADTESGIRQAALTFLRTNQHRETAAAAVEKQLEKVLPKVRKPKPTGRAASEGGGLEWDNQMAWYKMLFEALMEMDLEACVKPWLAALDTDNPFLTEYIAGKGAGIRDPKVVEALLSTASKPCRSGRSPRVRTTRPTRRSS
jgi:HEAT repeat protein